MEIAASIVWAFIASFLSIRIVKPIAIKTGLVDKPNERKLHSGAIPLVGGIAIFAGVLSAIKIFLPSSDVLNLFLLSGSIILLLGVLDDRHDLKVSYRLAVQAFAASIMIFGADLYIYNLGDIFGYGDIYIGVLGIILTLLAVIGAINAFNMVDGIDGLAGMLSIVTFSGLSLLFVVSDDNAWVIPLLFIASILAYLSFNLRWPRRSAKKIFMGDAGSMLIGLSVVWLLVHGSQGNASSFRPVTALWVVALPLMDMAAIMIRRIRKGQSPFKPDRDHLHHICLRAGLTSKGALIFITLFGALLVGIGVIGEIFNIPDIIMFALFIIIFLIYNLSLSRVWRLVSWIRSSSNKNVDRHN